MKTPSQALQDRFVEFFRTNVDLVVAIAEHFSRDFLAAVSIGEAVFTESWRRFPATDPELRHISLYDHLYRRIWELDLSPKPAAPLPYPPIEGEWSPLRPSDVWAATALLHAAETADPRIDWPLLHLLVRAEVVTETWALITQRSVQDTARRISAYQLASHRAVAAAALELAGPDCPERPSLARGATVDHITAHTASCVRCNGFSEILVPVPRLMAAAASTDLGPAGRQQILNAVLSASESSKGRLRRR